MKTSTTKQIIISILASFVLCLNANALSDALKVKIVNGTQTDETVIRFLPSATAGFDGSYDAYKLFSSSPVIPSVFTQIDSVSQLSINALPALTAQMDLQLFTYIKVAGNYTFQSIEMGTGFPANTKIVLEDRQTGMLYDFRNGSSMTVALDVNTLDSASRFVMHFAPSMISVPTNVTCNGLTNGSVTVTKPGNVNWNYEIKDLNAITIDAGSNINETATISNLAAGTYTLYTSGNYMTLDSTTITITEPAPVVADFSSSNDAVFLSAALIQFTNNSSNTTISSWDFGDGSGVSDSTSPSYQFAAVGMYNVTLTASDSMGCSASISKYIAVKPDPAITTGINEAAEAGKLNVYQNDGAMQINLTTDNQSKIMINVYNGAGQLIHTYSNEGSGSFSETVQLPAAGMYIVQSQINNSFKTQKFTFSN